MSEEEAPEGEESPTTEEEAQPEGKTRGPKFFVPEVIQTSAMDCGPATLKATLGGFGIHVNYDRLRERCQTDVDGTSVAALEQLGQQLGLNAESILVPLDTLLMKDAKSLPAIVITNTPGGYHFVVVWSVHGDYLQIMDPGAGRSFVKKDRFLERVATVTLPFEPDVWRDWAETGSDSRTPLIAKIKAIGGTDKDAEAFFAYAEADATWRTFAALDAAVRMARALVDSGAIVKGPGAVTLVSSLIEESVQAVLNNARTPIPDVFWTAQGFTDDEGTERLAVKGAVLLYVESAALEPEATLEDSAVKQGVSSRRLSVLMPQPVPGRRSTLLGENTVMRTMQMGNGNVAGSRLSVWSGHVMPKTMVQELAANEVRPAKLFWDLLRLDASAAVYVAVALTALSIVITTIDVMMMRALPDILGRLTLASQRITIIGAIVFFLIVAFVLGAVRAQFAQRMGRGLETRLRVSFLEKLPRLEDRYLRTRPLSDMASRAHLLQMLRGVPAFAIGLFSSVLDLFITGGLLIWIFPQRWWLVVITLAISMAIPVVAFKGIDEYFAKIAAHGGALFRFYLDALLGVVPVRVHGAERVVRRQHEELLTEWARSSYNLQRAMFGVQIVEGLIGGMITVGLVYSFVTGGGDISKMLILIYFAQRIPAIGGGLVGSFTSWPSLKHNALRLFEPLGAAETNTQAQPPGGTRIGPTKGVKIVFRNVEVVAGGNALLKGLKLEIPSGAHIGIVGASGAGKSTLLSVLLGWLTPTEGRVMIDGRPLDSVRLARLREEIAWVDPGIQLWNSTILDNMMYGSNEEAIGQMQEALHLSDVVEVLERSPDGLLTNLGEGGARVSGGQGQRIRFGRALMKKHARLVLLDEPFRGLERDRRQALLDRARTYWKDSTLMLVSHDVSDTLGLDRVLVVDGGEVIEDGPPAELMLNPESRYRALVEADRGVRVALWEETDWRRVRLDRGALVETRAIGKRTND